MLLHIRGNASVRPWLTLKTSKGMKLRALDKYTPTLIPGTLRNSISLLHALLHTYAHTSTRILYRHTVDVARQFKMNRAFRADQQKSESLSRGSKHTLHHMNAKCDFNRTFVHRIFTQSSHICRRTIGHLNHL